MGCGASASPPPEQPAETPEDLAASTIQDFVRNPTSVPEQRIMDAFKAFDMDSSGFICGKEFRHILTQYGTRRLTEEEVKYLFEETDLDGDGKIYYKEFVKSENASSVIHAFVKSEVEMAESDVIAAFQNFDSSKSGSISASELHRILTTCGKDRLTAEEADKVIAEAKLGSGGEDGLVSYDQYVHSKLSVRLLSS
mmetsp:Transcript_62901/g.109823  ORF Transcript_62901/g.109823 Transcript_62901/m.109823 type:complete len:196 (-) Transcript_62901:34-621(-)